MKRLFKFLSIVGLSFLLIACGGGGGSTSSSGSSKKWRIMPLGNSITFDYSPTYYDANGNILVPLGMRTGYRAYLAYALDDAGVNYDFVGSQRAGYSVEPPFDPDNEGHPGWTSYQIANNVYSYLSENPADIILLHIGTNDQSSSIEGVKQIINEIKRFETDHNMKIKIFVALIINQRFHNYTIDAFNNNLEAYLNELDDPNVITVDMRNLLNSNEYIDNYHPSKSGYKKMADRWFSAIIDYVK